MPSSGPYPALVGDIGGTNARFALATAAGIERSVRYAVEDFSDPGAAIEAFFAEAGSGPRPRHAALAFAGPVAEGRARLTNGRWQVASEDLAARFGFEQVHLINDFAALALALPALGEADLLPVGGGRAAVAAPMAVLGPGTGLGLAALVPGPGGAVVLTTEGGHVTMAPADAREGRILDRLRARFGHVSAERVISGEGLENLFQAIAEEDGLAAPARPDAEIVDRALAGDCPASRAALETFCAMLGTVAGNAALSLGALGGVYIAGGMVPRFAEFFAASGFRARFETKGRFRDYMARIPTRLIVHPEPAFLGLRSRLGTC